MVVVLNKVDQLPEEGRSKVINKAKKRLRQTLGSTKFGGCAMVPTAVKPGTQCTLSRSPGACACFAPISLQNSTSHMLDIDAVSAPAQSTAWNVLLSHLCTCSDSSTMGLTTQARRLHIVLLSSHQATHAYHAICCPQAMQICHRRRKAYRRSYRRLSSVCRPTHCSRAALSSLPLTTALQSEGRERC